MTPILQQGRAGRLERLCSRSSGGATARAGRIRLGSGADGIERLEAYFQGQAFRPHRHDTYAIGITLSGVQTFRYRGVQRRCLPGQCHMLHPDETHDGAAGTNAGFGYRIIYLDPRLVQEALGGRPLPFVKSPVVDASLLPGGLSFNAWDMDAEIDDVARIEIVVVLADLLVAASFGRLPKQPSPAFAAVSRIRDLIAPCPVRRHTMAEFERLSGLDRKRCSMALGGLR